MIFSILGLLNGKNGVPENPKPVHLIVDSDLLFEKNGQTDAYRILDSMGCDINPEKKNARQTHVEHDEKILEPEIEDVIATAATKRQLEESVRRNAIILANREVELNTTKGAITARKMVRKDKRTLTQADLEQRIKKLRDEGEELVERLKRENEKIERLKQAYVETGKYQTKEPQVSIDDIMEFLDATSMLRARHINAGGKRFFNGSPEGASEEEQAIYKLFMRAKEIEREIVEAVVAHEMTKSKMGEEKKEEVEIKITNAVRSSQHPLEEAAILIKNDLGVKPTNKMDLPAVVQLFEQLRVIHHAINIKGDMAATGTLRTDFHDRIAVVATGSPAERAYEEREAARAEQEKRRFEEYRKSINGKNNPRKGSTKPEDDAA